jgi:nitrogen regulatory protein PII-like uncharacterized protein
MSLDESIATDPFGRFLIKQSNEWREIGVQAERERIIKLLEDYQQQALVSNIVYLGLERAIKIIKGEIK